MPVSVGLVLGERPGFVQFAGIAVAVVGVVLAGGPQLRGAPVQRRAVLLTLVAALGFGTVFVLITEASTTVTGLFLALFVQRVTNVATGGAALYVSVRRGAPALPEGGLALASLPRLRAASVSATSPRTAPTPSPPSTARSRSPPCWPRCTRW